MTLTMRVGRIPYINCYPVYGAIDRGIVRARRGAGRRSADGAEPRAWREGQLDVSVVSAVEYARDARRYLLLPDLAISCDGPVRSVMLFSKRPADASSAERRVLVSRSSMTSVALLELLFENVWHARPEFVPATPRWPTSRAFERARTTTRGSSSATRRCCSRRHGLGRDGRRRGVPEYPLRVRPRRRVEAMDRAAVRVRGLGRAAHRRRSTQALALHAALIASRDWGLAASRQLADAGGAGDRRRRVDACARVPRRASTTVCRTSTSRGSRSSSAGSCERGRVPNGTLAFLPAA